MNLFLRLGFAGRVPVNVASGGIPGFAISDSFEGYTDENPVTQTLNKGVGFSAAFTKVTAGAPLEIAADSFQSYSDEDPVTSSLSGGSGFSAAFTKVTA